MVFGLFLTLELPSIQALFLIEYLLRHANDRFIADARDRSDDIAKLRSYRYIEDDRDIAGDGKFSNHLNTCISDSLAFAIHGVHSWIIAHQR
jgi:hypothetical protein